MKAAPEGVAMAFDKIEREKQALAAIRCHWQLRGWKFSPLTRLDGENDTLESIFLLQNSPICWAEIVRHLEIESLLDDLETVYRTSLLAWAEHRTVFECKGKQQGYRRWPDGMYPAHIYGDARSVFWEMATTTRFSVNEKPIVAELECFTWRSKKLTTRHVVSLAAMVCIKEAIEALEWLEFWWIEEASHYLAGQDFKWVAQNDPKKIDQVLETVYDQPEDLQRFQQKANEAKESCNQAERWLEHLGTLTQAKREADFERVIEKNRQSQQARHRSKLPRKASTKKLTLEFVADFWNKRPTQKWEATRDELREIFKVGDSYTVSESTIVRRYREAKKKNLVS
jgi:hypothetical protein